MWEKFPGINLHFRISRSKAKFGYPLTSCVSQSLKSGVFWNILSQNKEIYTYNFCKQFVFGKIRENKTPKKKLLKWRYFDW